MFVTFSKAGSLWEKTFATTFCESDTRNWLAAQEISISKDFKINYLCTLSQIRNLRQVQRKLYSSRCHQQILGKCSHKHIWCSPHNSWQQSLCRLFNLEFLSRLLLFCHQTYSSFYQVFFCSSRKFKIYNEIKWNGTTKKTNTWHLSQN